MSRGGPRKVLRVGVVRDGQIQEERIFERGQALTVGPGLGAAFVLPAEWTSTLTLIDTHEGGYRLLLDPRVSGKVATEGRVVDLEELRADAARVKHGQPVYVLSADARGKLNLGSTTFLFQLVEPNAAGLDRASGWAFSAFRALDRVLAAVLLMSLLGHSSFVCYVWAMEAPPKLTYEDVGDVFVTDKHIRFPKTAPPPPAVEVKHKVEAPSGKKPTPKENAAPPKSLSEPERRAQAQEKVKSNAFIKVIASATRGTAGTQAAADAMDAAPAGLEDYIKAKVPLVTGAGLQAGASLTSAADGPKGPDIGMPDPIVLAKRPSKGPVTTLQPPADVMGPLDGAGIQQDLLRYKKAVSSCHTKVLNHTSGVEGRIEVRLIVGPDGAVRSTEVVDNTTYNVELETCLLSKMPSWRFRPFEGEAASFSVPFVFTAP